MMQVHHLDAFVKTPQLWYVLALRRSPHIAYRCHALTPDILLADVERPLAYNANVGCDKIRGLRRQLLTMHLRIRT